MFKLIKETIAMSVVGSRLQGEYNYLASRTELRNRQSIGIVRSQANTFEMWKYLPEGVGLIKIGDSYSVCRPGVSAEELVNLARWTLADLSIFINSNRWEIQVRRQLQAKK